MPKKGKESFELPEISKNFKEAKDLRKDEIIMAAEEEINENPIMTINQFLSGGYTATTVPALKIERSKEGVINAFHGEKIIIQSKKYSNITAQTKKLRKEILFPSLKEGEEPSRENWENLLKFSAKKLIYYGGLD